MLQLNLQLRLLEIVIIQKDIIDNQCVTGIELSFWTSSSSLRLRCYKLLGVFQTLPSVRNYKIFVCDNFTNLSLNCSLCSRQILKFVLSFKIENTMR